MKSRIAASRAVYRLLANDPEFARELDAQLLIAKALEEVARLMAERGVTKAELARRIGTRTGQVTRILQGRTVLSLRLLADIAHALGARVELKLKD